MTPYRAIVKYITLTELQQLKNIDSKDEMNKEYFGELSSIESHLKGRHVCRKIHLKSSVGVQC